MQQFGVIHSKDIIATTCMAIKPDKTKSNKQQKSLITIFTIIYELSASILAQKTCNTVRPNVVIVVIFNSFLS